MSQSDKYAEFNKFQTVFYTDRKRFGTYTNYEIKRNGYQLLNNLAKGFPNLINFIINLKGIGWSGVESPAILQALQTRFVNDFVTVRIPQFVYFKNMRVTTKDKKQKELDSSLMREVCNILRIDSKTFEAIRETDMVKRLIADITGEFNNKKTKSKKK